MNAIDPSIKPIAVRSDTVYYDSIYRQNKIDTSLIYTETIGPDLNYRYAVTIRNKLMEEGPRYDFADAKGIDPAGLVKVLSPTDKTNLPSGAAIKILWDKVSAAKQYQVYVFSNNNFTDTIFSGMTQDTIITLPGLFDGAYFLKLRAQSSVDSNWGFWTTERFFTVNLFKVSFNGRYDVNAQKLLKANDGGFLIIGSTRDANWNSILLAIKTDSTGKELWRYTETGFSPCNAVATDDNGFIIVGTTLNSITGNYTIITDKINGTGTTEWKNTYVDRIWLNNIPLIKTPDKGCIFLTYIRVVDTLFFNTNSIDTSHYILIDSDYVAKLVTINASGQTGKTIALDTSYRSPFFLSPCTSSSFAMFYKKSDMFTMATFDYSLVLNGAKQLDIPFNSLIMTDVQPSGASGFAITATDTMEEHFYKVSSDGAILSDIQFGSFPRESPTIQVTPDGGFVAVSVPSSFTSAIKITELNSSCKILMSSIYGNYASGYILPEYSFVLEPNGAIVVAYSNSNAGLNEIVLIKTSKTGIGINW